jgi:ssDNA-binding Zn-finger/Zn-ribbon topoisomerase 1
MARYKNMEKRFNNTDFLAKCSVCDNSLEAEGIVVIEEKEQKTTLHVTCPKCHSASIIFLSNNQSGIMSVGMATDLDALEVREKIGQEAISADELIDLHQFVLREKVDIIKLVRGIE